ncbi:MAG: DUF2314 domain-containing protein [Rhodobacteraceae bacterium]|jgi:uncharacterized protein YegJ (DUF2314 family)|nr:DUF2314 domain-containing protein [Paracoccaceae bacterium]
MKPFVALTLLALTLVAPQTVLAQDPVTEFAADDSTMNTAIAEAQRTLPLFLANALDAEQIGREGAGVKVGMPTVTGTRMDTEHIWVSPFRLWPDGTLSGYLANEPVDLGPLREGDRVDFAQAQISDWSLFSPDGKMWGNYTSRVMHASGAFGATPFDQIFMSDPVPAEWR